MLIPILTTLFFVVSIALVLIILVQRPQGGGLTGAFGGGSGTDTAFGGRTGDALTVATITAFSIYLLIAIGLNIASNNARASAAVPETPAAETPEGGTTTEPSPPAAGDAPAAPSPNSDATPIAPSEPAPAAEPAPQVPTDTNPNAVPEPAPAPAQDPTTAPTGG